MASRAKMTGWYDPIQLIQIGFRVVSSTVFGSMFDRRELMASLDSPFNRPADFKADFDAHFDLSTTDGDFWFDFCADTGDGWYSTYAVARLLARPNLTVDSPPGGAGPPITLARGEALVFGGDEVYPTPSKERYEDQLQAPFVEANRVETHSNEPLRRKDGTPTRLYVVPGNHDWYDGLTAFAHLFCNRHPFRAGSAASPGRAVCGRETHQARPYFALKLPHNWWLCAFDIQLDGYIDQAQLSFFEYIAQELMEAGSNIILVAGVPIWAYSRKETLPEFRNFSFASLVATGALKRVDGLPTKQHNLRLVLTGDSHHYAHFIQTQEGSRTQIHLLTCGLGGAFLHPTHWLQDTHVNVKWRQPPPLAEQPNGKGGYTHNFTLKTHPTTQEKVTYPDFKTSSGLTWRNFLFAWHNPWFAAFMMGFGLFATWLLHFSALVLNSTLVGTLHAKPLGAALCKLAGLLLTTPWPLLMILGIGGALIYFTDYKPWPKRITVGVLHTLAHVLLYFTALLVIARSVSGGWTKNDVAVVVITAVVAGIGAATVMGVYLFIMLNVFKVHWNEAFSSLRIANYDGFLRLKIDASGKLTVYSIAIDKVPTGDQAALAPRLIQEPLELSPDI
jgi:Calcineurin-like phosphoesterase